jgi:hypothetical protein
MMISPGFNEILVDTRSSRLITDQQTYHLGMLSSYSRADFLEWEIGDAPKFPNLPRELTALGLR